MSNTRLGISPNSTRSKRDVKPKSSSSYLELLGSNVRSASKQRASRAQLGTTRTVDRGRATVTSSSRTVDKEVLFVTEDFYKVQTENGFILLSDGQNFFYYTYE